MKRIPVFSSDGSRVVAVILGDTLTKSIDASKHMLRAPVAIAIDAHALNQAERLGVQRVDVFDRESGRTYTTTLTDLRTHGWSFDRGFGAQVALRLSRWQVDGEPAPATEARTDLKQPPAQPEPAQLALWGPT